MFQLVVKKKSYYLMEHVNNVVIIWQLIRLSNCVRCLYVTLMKSFLLKGSVRFVQLIPLKVKIDLSVLIHNVQTVKWLNVMANALNVRHILFQVKTEKNASNQNVKEEKNCYPMVNVLHVHHIQKAMIKYARYQFVKRKRDVRSLKIKLNVLSLCLIQKLSVITSSQL